jgi:hypothetical protein
MIKKMYTGLHVQYRILMKHEFYRQIFEKYKISNFMQTRPVGAELFHADRRADVTKVIVAFRNFENAPKKLLQTRDYFLARSSFRQQTAGNENP